MLFFSFNHFVKMSPHSQQTPFSFTFSTMGLNLQILSKTDTAMLVKV